MEHDRPLRAEHQVLLALADPAPGAKEAEQVRALLAGPFDWGVFLDSAVRQYVLALVARNLSRLGLLAEQHAQGKRPVPNPHALALEHAYLANRLRNERLRDEVEEIAWHARQAGLDLLLRKGLALGVRLYDDHGVRISSDIDFLVRRADARKAVDTMDALGYVAGVADRAGRSVDPWSKEGQQLMYLSAPNLPQMVRTTGLLELPAVSVGLTTGLFERNSRLVYGVDQIFERSEQVQIGSARMRTPGPADTLIDLCAHFHKDAKSLFSIEYGKDLTLLKLVDLRLAWIHVDQSGQAPMFARLVEENGLTEVMHYALSFVDAAFPEVVPSNILTGWQPADHPDHLHRYGENEGQPAAWPAGSLLARVLDHERVLAKQGASKYWGLTESTADWMVPSAAARRRATVDKGIQ